MSKCCTQCFSDTAIATKINIEGEVSRCSYCGSNQVFCIEPYRLSDKLEIFTYGLAEASDGLSLREILIAYGVFDEQHNNIERLTQEIFGKSLSGKKYNFIFQIENYGNHWEDFKAEIMHRNRFFPRTTIYSALFSDMEKSKGAAVFFQLLEQLKSPIYPVDVFYRARISDSTLTADDMGCPPVKIATGGRANPPGIPYLYLSSDIETSISEVRPSNTSRIFVSNFNSLNNLFVLDLTNPRLLCSAASFEEEQLSDVLSYLDLLELLSYELSKPVRPENSHLDYIPTQFLCEFIKSAAKFDGILFRSSFSGGKNYVFFNAENFQPTPPSLYEVSRTLHEFNLVQDYE